jgi:hypothetical protein
MTKAELEKEERELAESLKTETEKNLEEEKRH